MNQFNFIVPFGEIGIRSPYMAKRSDKGSNSNFSRGNYMIDWEYSSD